MRAFPSSYARCARPRSADECRGRDRQSAPAPARLRISRPWRSSPGPGRVALSRCARSPGASEGVRTSEPSPARLSVPSVPGGRLLGLAGLLASARADRRRRRGRRDGAAPARRSPPASDKGQSVNSHFLAFQWLGGGRGILGGTTTTCGGRLVVGGRDRAGLWIGGAGGGAAVFGLRRGGFLPFPWGALEQIGQCFSQNSPWGRSGA